MNELNYASLEASKRLVEARIMLETEVAWFPMPNGWELLPPDVFKHTSCSVPAPSMAEVWRELPDNIQQIRCVPVLWREIDTYYVTYMQDFRGVSRFFHSHNPTDALIDLLIWVRKEATDGRS